MFYMYSNSANEGGYRVISLIFFYCGCFIVPYDILLFIVLQLLPCYWVVLLDMRVCMDVSKLSSKGYFFILFFFFFFF